jgi:hypothetical protein
MFYWEPLKRSVRIEGKVRIILYAISVMQLQETLSIYVIIFSLGREGVRRRIRGIFQVSAHLEPDWCLGLGSE